MKSYFVPVEGSTTGGHAPAGGESSPRPHAIVIGAGLGGLAAAIRMSAKGWRVTVLEKLDAAGGRAYVHRRDGFTFDAGPTIVTAPFMLDELWALVGRNFADDVKLVPMDPFYRVRFDDGSFFDYNGDMDNIRAQIARFCPADVAGYDRFVKEAEICYRLGFEELGTIPYETLGDLLRAVPNLVRMRGWRSIYSMVASHFSDPKLRMVMSFHPLLIGGNPFSVTCVYALINTLERRYGVHWVTGGTGALVQAMVRLINDQGARVRCRAEVARITVEPGSTGRGRATGVTLANGEHIPADIVVSNADTMWTYRHLIDAKYRRHWTDRKIENGRYSMGLFVWYFGTNRRWDDVPHHMMLLGERYESLLTDIFKKKVLAKDFSLSLIHI